MPTPTYTLIASSTVGAGGASTITLSSIPSTYTDLMLVFSARTNNASSSTDAYIAFNGSSTGYTNRYLRGNGSAASSGNFSSSLGIYFAECPGASWTSNTFSNNAAYIPNYAGSSNKSVSADFVSENNATLSYAQFNAGLWSNTAAITSITISNAYSDNFVQYTTAYLYGISKS